MIALRRTSKTMEDAEAVRAVGAEHTVLVTDYAGTMHPPPHEAMAQYLETMREHGVGEAELATQPVQRFLALSTQERTRNVQPGGVLLLGAAGRAGGEAAAEVRAGTQRPVLHGEQLRLVGQTHRRRGGAVPELERVHQHPHRRTRALGPQQRAPILRAVIHRTGRDEHPRRRLPWDPDEADRPLLLVLHVERRTQPSDLAELAQQGSELARMVVPLHTLREPHDLRRLLARLGAEVAEETAPDADGLPHVQHLSARPDQAIDAGPVLGRRLHDRFQRRDPVGVGRRCGGDGGSGAGGGGGSGHGTANIPGSAFVRQPLRPARVLRTAGVKGADPEGGAARLGEMATYGQRREGGRALRMEAGRRGRPSSVGEL